MSKLPEWIKACRPKFPTTRDGIENALMFRALSIAWEALGYGYIGRSTKLPGMSAQDRPLSKSEIQLSLLEARKRIEELGQ